MDYLKGLNSAQKEAVLATSGPVSVLAGAGSGKTKVLTTRIYHLIRQGVAPESILAVTFTNKAAREMRERVRAMLGAEESVSRGPREGSAKWGSGAPSSLPFVATFHGLGRELLETYGSAIGLPRYFSVYDRDDSERVIAQALKALDVSTKELSPRAVLSKISKAKGAGETAESFNEKYGRGSFGGRIAALAWLAYEKTLKEEKALDFDDLIVKPVRLLEEHADIRAQAQDRWHYLHIDEYQDTNELQGRLIQMLAAKHQHVFVVGDIDQCLAAGTRVRMADGSETAIERIRKGDMVRSNFGSGSLRSARVLRVHSRSERDALVRITTKNSRTLTSTADHVHFAGYRLGHTPQLFFTYLMHKQGKGWRLGVSQVYTRGQRKPMLGFQQQCNHEHADDVWIVGVFDTPQEARVHEYCLSLDYRIPTLPFVARKGTSVNGYVHDQEVLDQIFASFDTEAAAQSLLKAEGLLREYPHHRAQSMTGHRRNVTITLCADKRGATPMHRVSMVGRDARAAQTLRAAGFSIRRAKTGSASWRFETVYKDFGHARAVARAIQDLLPDTSIVEVARLGGYKDKPNDGNSLPFLPAGSVRRGMALFDSEGRWDIVEKVERVAAGVRVYDLDVEDTHNFIANGITTHNCIYTWRGATIENLLEFEKQYPSAKTIVLEHNYRSTGTIVQAANGVIELNKNRKEKRSVTDNPSGAPIVVHAALSGDREARWIARKARELMREGVRPEEIAVLFRTNFQSRALEEGLLREGVPYKLLGTRFFECKEVKDALAWLRLALDPSREADYVRAAAAPPRGIGKVLLGKLAAGQRAALSGAEKIKVEAFELVINELAAAAETLTVSELVKLMVEKSGLRKKLVDEGSEEDRERFENVEELATVAVRYDGLPGKEGLAAFLADAALTSDQDELDRTDKKGVTLMTVHAAKGLEFRVVFVAGMEEGLFPHEGMGRDEDRDEEEERRLFYVAITRARERLFLSLARVRKIYGSDFLQEPSSFVRDIDRALVDYDEDDDEPVIRA